MQRDASMSEVDRAKTRQPAFVADEIVVLPIQIITPASWKLDGVRRLMAAVLVDGAETFCRTAGAAGRRPDRLHEEAAAWIFSDDRGWPYSFLSLCDALEVDADALREKLLRWKVDATRGTFRAVA